MVRNGFMNKRFTGDFRIFPVFNGALLTLIAVLTAYPLIHVIMASVSDGTALISHKGVLFLPAGPISFDAYVSVFANPNIWTGYGNTLFILVAGVSLQLFLTSLGAYVLSRKQFWLRNPIMFLITFTMFFQGGMIPFYLLVKDLHLINSLLSLILPFSVSAYNLIIMRTSFTAIPESLEESAKLDGAGHFFIYANIVMPLSKAVISVMILYYGVAIWNGWFWASVFIRDHSLFPLQLILREILIRNDMTAMTQGISSGDVVGISETIKYATIIVATVPILVVYPFLQKHFAQGVMIGAIKE